VADPVAALRREVTRLQKEIARRRRQRKRPRAGGGASRSAMRRMFKDASTVRGHDAFKAARQQRALERSGITRRAQMAHDARQTRERLRGAHSVTGRTSRVRDVPTRVRDTRESAPKVRAHARAVPTRTGR